MDLKELIEKLKAYPLAIACFFLFLVFAIAIFTRGGLADELSITEADFASQLRSIEENNKNAEGLREDLVAIKALNETIKSRLMDRDERAININFFYNLEEQYDVTYSSIVQQPGEYQMYSKGGVRGLKLHSTVVFNLSLSGSFKEVLRFMHGLEQTELLLRVADYAMNDAGTLGDPDRVNASMRIVVLAKPDKK